MPDDTTAVDRRERKQARARDILELRQRLGSPAPLALPHQAVFHWDSLDQVNALVEARDAEPELGFMMRLLALCTLPRTRPPSTQREYHRVNGPFTLYMNALGGAQLPFGTLPRLLLAWICSEAVRTQSRTSYSADLSATSCASSESSPIPAARAAIARASGTRCSGSSART